MTGMPVPPPPPPSLQQQILMMWAQKLAMAQFQPPDGPSLGKVLQWRAHMEAHKMIGEMAQASASQGMPVMAAPGAPATAAGTQPTIQSPPAGAAAAMGNTLGGAAAVGPPE